METGLIQAKIDILIVSETKTDKASLCEISYTKLSSTLPVDRSNKTGGLL